MKKVIYSIFLPIQRWLPSFVRNYPPFKITRLLLVESSGKRTGKTIYRMTLPDSAIIRRYRPFYKHPVGKHTLNLIKHLHRFPEVINFI